MAPAHTTRVAIIGGGIAGISTAAALARAGAGPGIILERESIPGSHASGRNAGIASLTEFDPVVRRLAIEGVRALRRMSSAGHPILRPTGGLHLGRQAQLQQFTDCVAVLKEHGTHVERLGATEARERFPFLSHFSFDQAIYNADEGVIDIHALLLAYLDEARQGGFTLLTRTQVDDLQVEGGRAVGLATSRGPIRAEVIIDAAGAWAGRIGQGRPLRLQPIRRHLFVSATSSVVPADAPLLWHVSDQYYLRPEGAGLLLSPCDESFHDAAPPTVDPAMIDVLAAKLIASAPRLADLPISSSWACLRTFAPDRRPVIGPDPEIAGLFHVSALGGSGMGTSWAVGHVAAAVVQGISVPFIDPADVAPGRVVGIRDHLGDAGPEDAPTGASMTNA